MSFILSKLDLHKPVADWYAEYLASDSWKSKRAKLIRERGSSCEWCKANDCHVLHHKTYARLFNELDVDLVLLCKTCHKYTHEVHDIPYLYFIYWPSKKDIEAELRFLVDEPQIRKPINRTNPSKRTALRSKEN